MTALRYLSLEGNRIRRLPDEAFQNLHYLSRLNLAFNELEILDFAAFDSIGTLSHLTIDLSHNALQVRLTQPLCFCDLFYISHNLSLKVCSFFPPFRDNCGILVIFEYWYAGNFDMILELRVQLISKGHFGFFNSPKK